MKLDPKKRYSWMQRLFLRLARNFIVSGSGKKEHQRFFEELLLISFKGLNIGSGVDLEDSGELNMLREVVGKYKVLDSELIIFDIGANIGKYANNCMDMFGKKYKVQLFSFEPSEKTFSVLSKNTADRKGIVRVNAGLGAEKATLSFFSDKENSGLASLYERKLDHFDIKMKKTENVQILKLDDYCSEKSITHIDFLKLDVEGNELNVLKGGKQMIESNAIDFIQFEFGGSNIDSRTYFQDFYYTLSQQYDLYRIVKDGLYKLDNYKEAYELFITTNFLAVNRSLKPITPSHA
jgi:FkbM family methyltransferase